MKILMTNMTGKKYGFERKIINSYVALEIFALIKLDISLKCCF